MNIFLEKWIESIYTVVGRNGQSGTKLWTYSSCKYDFNTEPYIVNVMSYSYRSALAKFRCGIAPIRLETGRYERLSVN